MRVLLITDSLGCPRHEIDVKYTWTNKILSKYSNKVEVYTYCYPGLSADDININYVKFLKPDLIVLQVGVADACRRALSRNELFVIRHIPIIKRLVGLKILNPYTKCVDKYILSDGHHLNIKGDLDVFCAVDAAIETYLQEKNVHSL
ncbi:hypothetical protein [Selenomonas ruminantium]|uniref:Uncharacterized protein n=1 Tax=Selenomonas ruminantium TaxID=971 RepID=A0A1I0XZ02_SELRU|nr:hypothetical protein [Selenomonas ruminantium]SFB05580.1 hypothetical protein SAMN05216587_10848 [Selenomonas ruminantium]